MSTHSVSQAYITEHPHHPTDICLLSDAQTLSQQAHTHTHARTHPTGAHVYSLDVLLFFFCIEIQMSLGILLMFARQICLRCPRYKDETFWVEAD